MSLHTRLIVGNWKLHGNLAENQQRLTALCEGAQHLASPVRMAVCVPFPYLAQAQSILCNSPIAWGTQDISAHVQGAYTGEVSAVMAAEFGARFVIVGHSERRLYHHETHQAIAQKVLRVIEAQLTPILCLGETREQRDQGNTETVVGQQLQSVLDTLSDAQAACLVLAYEPVWAIGAACSAQPHEAQTVHAFLRRQLAKKSAACAHIPILYGGSLKDATAAALLAQPDINGGLIGGASLIAQGFLSICRVAQQI